ncbi:MAG: cupin domain-containing protein [Proteobacteria bacterium]|nr:cupin domain-containing protein [Pseudomonadota bacterium]
MNAQTPASRRSAQPDHHPGEELIVAYASGALDEANALAIASHMTLCPVCRDAVALYETLGGSLMDHLPPAPLADGALIETLARAKAMPATSQPRSSLAAHGTAPLLPAPLRHYVGGDIDAAKWRPLGAGIHHMPLINGDSVTARLLRIGPGRSVFDHTHGGTELTVVLDGSYTSQGQHFTRGDIEVADETVHHRPVASMKGACVCLVVTDAPLRFHSWLGRLMQPFIGI